MNSITTEPSCGCCEGLEPITPEVIANRPGLPALAYRVGTHSSFLETMLARLSQLTIDLPQDGLDERGQPQTERIAPLLGLRTRALNDPAIALLDAWAMVGDVLTFYQERIANEGYLRTATERRSILELARLVGYSLRPGVASTIYLAFTLEKDSGKVIIPAGSRAQSIPGPEELPQPFETSDPLEARLEWNVLKPRLVQPQYITLAMLTPDEGAPAGAAVPTLSQASFYLKPATPALKPNDAIVLSFRGFSGEEKDLYRVLEVKNAPATPGQAPAAGPILNGQNGAGPQGEERVLITVQPWEQGLVQPEEEPAVLSGKAAILQIIEKYKLLEDFKISADNVLANSQIFPILDGLQAAIDPLDDSNFPAILDQLGPAIDKLQAALDELDLRFNRLHAWLSGLVAELRGVQQEMAGAIKEPGSFESEGSEIEVESSVFTRLLEPLSQPPALQPANQQRLARPTRELFSTQGDMAPRLLVSMKPGLELAYQAWANTKVPVTPPRDGSALLDTVYVMRVKAGFFGNNLPGRPVYEEGDVEGTVVIDRYDPFVFPDVWPGLQGEENDPPANIYLDREVDGIQLGSWVAIDRPTTPDVQGDITFHKVTGVGSETLSAMGVSLSVTRLTLDPPWLDELEENDVDEILLHNDALKGTRVFALSELVELAEEPTLGDVQGDMIELDRLYDGLQTGRWVIVSGERTDIEGTQGIMASELVMLANVVQDVQRVDVNSALPGDQPHTYLQLARSGLSYKYKRDTVKIYANVVKATHGETRTEVLGSGDGSRAFQTFNLRNLPLTYVPAPNASGIENTLQVRVNDLLWHEAPRLPGLGPRDRRYIVKIEDDGKTNVVFGDGVYGARLPTGVENVKAVYRSGIGKPGNVKAGQVSLLVSRPLGVKEVINPLPASGGADKESRDQARRNAPLALMALDRLVSVRDYEDFARTFAGIGKASAARLTDGYRQFVHITIAGAEDIPIDVNSDLYRNFRLALGRLGDPHLPFVVAIRERATLVIEAGVHLQPDYLWEAVEPQVRAALLDAFSFERRELGQDVTSSEVIAAIQAVEGVAYVDLDILDMVDEQRLKNFLDRQGEFIPGGPNKESQFVSYLNLTYHPRLLVRMARPDPGNPHNLLPAQIAYLDPAVQDTLILKELP